MNLYLLTQDENTGYDTFDSCIVAAETEEDARNISPSWNGKFKEGATYYDWASSPENVRAKLIGIATDGTHSGVILASFNAG